MNRSLSLLIATATAASLTGCSSMSGISGSSGSFACPAPKGAGGGCQSISQVYDNPAGGEQVTADAKGNGKPSDAKASETKPAVYASAPPLSPRGMEAPTTGIPIRQAPVVLRIWIAPWEDEANNLHDQSYIYSMVSPGKWLIEATKTRLAGQFRPVFPLKKHGGIVATESKAATAPQGPQAAPLGGMGVRAPVMGQPSDSSDSN